MAGWLVLGLFALGDAPYSDIFKARGPGGGTDKTVVSMWGPSLVRTKHNTTVAFGESDRSGTDHDGFMSVARSTDNGNSWSAPRMLLGYGSPAALYSPTADTIFVFFGEGAPPPKHGPPFGVSAMSCAGHAVHWQATASRGLANTAIQSPGSPLGVAACEAGVTPTSGDSLAVGMQPNAAEPCPAGDLEWSLDSATGKIVHSATGLCLTVPAHKSAVLEPCGAGVQGQTFVWAASATGPFTIQLAPGMFRAGECIGFVSPSGGGAVERTPGQTAQRERAARAARAGREQPCAAAQTLYCGNASRFTDIPACDACLHSHLAELKAAKCTAAQIDDPALFCGGVPGPAPRVGPNGAKSPPAGTGTNIMRSVDDGVTWSAPELIDINNTWGPHYAGNDVAHGVEMAVAGPHAGRLVMARRYDVLKSTPTFARSFVIYSDDLGKTWVRLASTLSCPSGLRALSPAPSLQVRGGGGGARQGARPVPC